MNFIERRISEYKTAPDVRRVKSGGGEKARRVSSPLLKSTSKATLSGVTVSERKKMFEQSDSVYQTAVSSFGSVSGRRGSKQRKEVSRNSSFSRATKKMRSEDGHSPVMSRAKIGQPNTNWPLWKKLRHFGHFDLQSLSIEGFSPTQGTGTEHNVKKPTGASAAHSDSGGLGEKTGLYNTLVSACPAFTNEIGGDSDWLVAGNPILMLQDCLSVDKQRRVGSREKMILDGDIPFKSRGPMSRQVSDVFLPKTGISYPFEFIDFGASYYRNYFLHNDHQNFFGVDESLGPIAISIRRDKVPDMLGDFYNLQANSASQLPPKHFYRVIFRTSELCTLRGTILEESIPTGAKTGTSKSIPPRDIVEYITQGELQLSCLKLGKSDKKVLQELVRLDEQELNNKYKIGVIYCKPGQETEEDMYNNECGSPAFDEFLELLGEKVRMKGFNKYRAQLDNKTDTTGEYSVYTEYRDAEVMFHVSTLLPHTASNKQQLLRKRHIGNDIVTIIFQESGCQQFSPKWIRSHFQHIFVIVRVENPNTKFTKYRVAVSRSTDIPFFGPTIPEGAVFDKNEAFRDFLLTKVINACNASLRNQKFSTMAIRTRRQYLNDLAEHSVTSTTIDQANTSGRVAGLLRNLGHKKKDRVRQDSTLIYTGGALTWHVSIIFRDRKPLPFSEECSNHIECIMGVGPDMVIFMDYFTKDTLLHIPTKDLSGWIIDKTRMNLFYDNCFCLSLDCHESEEDWRELITRMQAVAPRLTASHEAILMEFRRSSTGFLGFTINEAGVVERVDGLAKNSGLQANSRLLQVEDRLLCCHTHKQVTDLLTAKEKLMVRAYVIPPPPKGRHLLFYPEVNWAAVWASRPSHGDNEESGKVQQNGVEQSSGEGSGKVESMVELRKRRAHMRSHSHTNRLSYLEAMQTGEIKSPHSDQLLLIDDNEPIYDRLGDKGGVVGGVPPRSPTTQRARHESINYRRVKGSHHHRPTRESVLNLADDMMERKFTQSLDSYVPQPMEHTVSEVDITSPIQLTTSVQLPDTRAYHAEPLAPHLRRGAGGGRRPNIEVSEPLTPRGTVSRITKKFSYPSPASTQQSSPQHQQPRPTPPRHGNTPMKALASTSEMTKSNIPVKTSSTTALGGGSRDGSLEGKSWSNNVKMRPRSSGGGGKRAGNKRPASFDVALLINNERNVAETSRDDTSLHTFRKKSQSRDDLSPTDYDPSKPHPSSLDHQVPRSPTTGALISGDENEALFVGGDEDEEIPEFNEMSQFLSDEKHLSQNTGSQSSQDSIRNPKLTVRERTQRWEARGGGLPSYFSTLPKSFRHKATDPRRHDHTQMMYPPPTQSPTGEGVPPEFLEEEEEEEEMRRVTASSRKTSSSSRGSLASGIPIPTATKLRAARASALITNSARSTGGGQGSNGASKSLSPGRDEDGVGGGSGRSLASSGRDPSSNESSLERRMGAGSAAGVEGGAGKGSKLPLRTTTTTIQVSSRRTGQPVAQSVTAERVSSPTSDTGSSRSHKGSQQLHSRHSSIPVKRTNTPSNSTSSKGRATTTAETKSPPPPLHRRQSSGDSLELNYQEFDKNLSDMMQRGGSRGRGGAKNSDSAHIEEWLRQTSKDAVPPDMLGEGMDALRDIGSPTFTDTSQTSDFTQEMIESLKARVTFLEAKLDKESESNSDLRHKLLTAEQRLHEAQGKRNQKATSN